MRLVQGLLDEEGDVIRAADVEDAHEAVVVHPGDLAAASRAASALGSPAAKHTMTTSRSRVVSSRPPLGSGLREPAPHGIPSTKHGRGPYAMHCLLTAVRSAECAIIQAVPERGPRRAGPGAAAGRAARPTSGTAVRERAGGNREEDSQAHHQLHQRPQPGGVAVESGESAPSTVTRPRVTAPATRAATARRTYIRIVDRRRSGPSHRRSRTKPTTAAARLDRSAPARRRCR